MVFHNCHSACYFPNSPLKWVAHQLVQPSLQNSACLGQHQGGPPDSAFCTLHFAFERGRGRQAMHLPCKQANVGALPADSTFYCGEDEIRASLISSASVGATPTPATTLNPKAEIRNPKSPQNRNTRRSLFQIQAWLSCFIRPSTFGLRISCREVIRLPDCKSGVAKQSRKRRTGALPALPSSKSYRGTAPRV